MAIAWTDYAVPYEWDKICSVIGVNPSRVKHIGIDISDEGPIIVNLDVYLTLDMVRAIWPIPDTETATVEGTG